HGEMAEENYEGVVVRARDLMYKPKNRAMRMRKYKEFIDEEFVITDAICDDGVDRENFRWICEKLIYDDNGQPELKTFSVKPMGTREMRWQWYDNSDDYLGKLLTVRWQPPANY